MVPAAGDRPRRDLPRSPNGKFDRELLRQRARRHEPTSSATAFGRPTAVTPSAASTSSASPRASASTPFFAYDRAPITERVALLRATLPADVKLSYAIKANPMPAVVQHLSGLVDAFDIASAGELRIALDTPMPAERVSFAGPGKTPAELTQAVAAGVTIELESATEARRVIAIGDVARHAVRASRSA